MAIREFQFSSRLDQGVLLAPQLAVWSVEIDEHSKGDQADAERDVDDGTHLCR
jgi:hypothetical protein